MFNMYKYLWFYGTKPVDSTAKIQPSGKEVFVKQNQSVLDAALESGLDWPHDCKFGTWANVNASSLKVKLNRLQIILIHLRKEN